MAKELVVSLHYSLAGEGFPHLLAWSRSLELELGRRKENRRKGGWMIDKIFKMASFTYRARCRTLTLEESSYSQERPGYRFTATFRR